MDLFVFGKGLVLGLAIAAPLGPIGALCINRTLERGFWAGVAGGLGTAIADGVYACLAVAGFATVGTLIGWIERPLQVLGGLFLIYLGVLGLRKRPEVSAASVNARGLISTIAATFFLTIANPATILTFTAIFAGLGLTAGEGGTTGVLLVSGVFFGSLVWWFFLSAVVSLLRKRLPDGFSVTVSRISAVILIAFGLAALMHVLLALL